MFDPEGLAEDARNSNPEAVSNLNDLDFFPDDYHGSRWDSLLDNLNLKTVVLRS